jgi:hypothetical protein
MRPGTVIALAVLMAALLIAAALQIFFLAR